MAGAMTRTVLIVEDNELNRKLLDDILQAEGFSTVCLQSGEEALPAIRRNRPDLILMDIRLPGMSGLEATRAIKGDPALRGIPVVAVTACAMADDEENIRAAGCDGFIAKPFSIESLLRALAAFTAR
jgi:two-component system cell cycle response regulator DivK